MESAEFKMLEETAKELDQWIRTTETGGWSTQNLDAMKDRSQKIWALIGRKKSLSR